MLMDHAYAPANRVPRGVEHRAFTIYFYCAGFWFIQPGKNIHQCAFSRAIFTQKRVDFPAPERKVDVVIGKHARKAQHNIAHFDRIDLFLGCDCHLFFPIELPREPLARSRLFYPQAYISRR